MSRKKKNNGSNAVMLGAKHKPRPAKIVVQWEEYFRKGDREDWFRLMRDLGFEQEFTSITKCRKALKKVWVNIRDFLDAVRDGKPVRRFKSAYELADYTKSTRRFYPKDALPKGSPLRSLLAFITVPKHKAVDRDYDSVVARIGLLTVGAD